MDSQALVELANAARIIRTSYKAAAENLRRAEQHIAELRSDELLMKERDGETWQQNLVASERDARTARIMCERCAAEQNRLATILPTALPDLWPTLRLIDMTVAQGEPWHERPDCDWAAANADLRKIEAAALAKLGVTDMEAPTEGQIKSRRKQRTGRKPDPTIAQRNNNWRKSYGVGIKDGTYDSIADFARKVAPDEEYDTVRKALGSGNPRETS